MKELALASVAATFIASMASAAVVDVTSISGFWKNAAPGSTVGLNGQGTSEIRWGNSTGAGQSGYNFEAATTPALNVTSPFYVGDFVHLNFPITGGAIDSVELDLTVGGTVDGVAFSIGGTYLFDHFETPNSANPCAAGGTQPCPDLVTVLGGVTFSDSITLEGEEVFLSLDGFTAGTQFLTKEGQANRAQLFASFSAQPFSVVPVPASLPLLLAGVMGLGALRLRKRKG